MRGVMMLSREVRRVPLDYEPPRTPRGDWHPVFDRFYRPALAEWREAKRRWDAGERPEYATAEDTMPFEEWDGPEPDPAYHLPGDGWPEGAEMGIRMYETVTEGTPISRAYPDTPEGRRAMAEELAAADTSITSQFTVADWLEVIEQGTIMGTDVGTGEIVR